MAITVERAAGVCRIALDGEMTIYTALELQDALLAPLAQCERAELDLAGVSDIDTAGLQLLILAKTEAQARGHILLLSGHSPAVLALLALCDLESFFGDNVLIHTRA